MPRPSLGDRRALTLRLPVDVYDAVAASGGVTNDAVVARLRRSLAVDLSDSDVQDLQGLATEIGFANATELVRAFIAREWHNAEVRRRESLMPDERDLLEAVEEEPLEPPDEPAPVAPLQPVTVEPQEPPAPPFTADELAAPVLLPPPPRRNGTQPVVRVWQPPRPRPPRPPWERQGP